MTGETAPLLARVPPPVWAVLYLLVASAIGIAFPDLEFAFLRQPWPGMIAIVAGIALTIGAMATFKRAGTQILPASPVNDKLVETGPYKWTRNPMYLALVVVTAGIALRFGMLPLFAVPVLIYLTNDRVVIPYEERKMEIQYGDIFRGYMTRVRRWI